MKMYQYFLFPSLLFFQVSLCFAKGSLNLVFIPDPVTHCHHYGVDFAVAKNSTLGLLSAYNCPDRPTYGIVNGQVTNTFNRILTQWRYSPRGAFNTGYFFDAMVGVERSEFKSAAGSSANVSYFDTAIHLGYQWFWRNGFNVTGLIGVAHLMPVRRDNNISPTESSAVSDYMDEQTSTTTHVGGGFSMGWVF